jgi:hypothetical protein
MIDTEPQAGRPLAQPDPELLRLLAESGARDLRGEHDFAALSPENKLRALASLARFVHECRGLAKPKASADRMTKH